MAAVARGLLYSALILSVAVIVAACGSGSSGSGASTAKVTATAYATSLCGAVSPFEATVARSGSALDDVGTLSPSTGKAKFVAFLAALAADSGHAVSTLKSAGIPEVSGGAAFSASMLETFTRLQGTLSRSEKVAQQLSTSSESTFRTGADQLSTAVKESIGDIDQGLAKHSSKALNAAAAKVAACHSL